MYGISPDDRLWLVKQDHDERRRAATADRMAASARSAEKPSAPDVATATPHGAWTRIRHVMHLSSFGHGLAHHGVGH